jgi:hypothetical protein
MTCSWWSTMGTGKEFPRVLESSIERTSPSFLRQWKHTFMGVMSHHDRWPGTHTALTKPPCRWTQLARSGVIHVAGWALRKGRQGRTSGKSEAMRVDSQRRGEVWETEELADLAGLKTWIVSTTKMRTPSRWTGVWLFTHWINVLAVSTVEGC